MLNYILNDNSEKLPKTLFKGNLFGENYSPQPIEAQLQAYTPVTERIPIPSNVLLSRVYPINFGSDYEFMNKL